MGDHLLERLRAMIMEVQRGLRLAISLTGVDVIATEGEEDLLALDEALSRLESIDPRASRVVELRYFAGLSEREAA